VIGGGGLGDLAIRYGYQRFNNEVMFGTVLILVAMVQGVQMAGDRLVRSLAHRR
ncbi:metal ABC transporter permease, partial [Klebsiella pneumoniae]